MYKVCLCVCVATALYDVHNNSNLNVLKSVIMNINCTALTQEDLSVFYLTLVDKQNDSNSIKNPFVVVAAVTIELTNIPLY